ncbi:hypothetical protein Taro_043720 [Colocasia esculenta]|uniref:Transmembrane protein n=1 Tax=Colocasia esculenta TaxID=4460 RepID=A0A843WLT6_COLES|nr:hypothetical protein [Colocasia esculenta]
MLFSSGCSVSCGDTWLFLPDLMEVQDVGACVVRLWSLVVAPVFFASACVDSAGSAGVIFGLTWVVVEAFALFPLLCRDSLSQEFIVRRSWWQFFVPCVASSVSCLRIRGWRRDLRETLVGVWEVESLQNASA